MMIPSPFSPGVPPWLQMIQPVPSVTNSFWKARHIHDHLRKLQDTSDLLKAVWEELDAILSIKESNRFLEEEDDTSHSHLLEKALVSFGDVRQSSRNNRALLCRLFEVIKNKKINVNVQESLTLEAANFLLATLTSQLTLFNFATSQTSSWEERSIAVKLANKIKKSKRNIRWRRRKRKHIIEILQKEHDRYDQVDQDADEWRAREIAKDIAKRKVEKMKEIARLKAKEERQILESELELVLMVEKLQELRSVRIQKLKKQGHFLPEEDDKFLERVQAAVEEEERQAAAAADTDAAKDAIATAEESRKTIQGSGANAKDPGDIAGAKMSLDGLTETENQRGSGAAACLDSGMRGLEVQTSVGSYDSVANLPVEFYHYYHGSNTDMGTLIEVRRMWDAYIRPGGSRIPGRWVEPPPPADEIWASYLVVRK